jgi:uncharacterized membrane protein YjdF
LAKVSLAFAVPGIFLAAPIARRPSGKAAAAQGGSVMRMSFFWLAALVFACAGECRGQFSRRAFYLLDRPAINQFASGICVKTPAARQRFSVVDAAKSACILSLTMRQSLTRWENWTAAGYNFGGAFSGSQTRKS